jgi:hypothetical protein
LTPDARFFQEVRVRATALFALIIATAAGAGDIIVGECSSCGYTVDEVFYGRGFYPYSLTLLYSSRELGEVVEVDFDFARRLADSLGVEPPENVLDNHQFVDEHRAEYDALFDGWSPPENLADLADADGRPPAWVIVYSELDRLPGDLTLIDPYAGPLVCPRCGEPTLGFEMVGCWD